MYWSMYFVTTPRQLAGKFSLPFKPPVGGLTMYGYETNVFSIEHLIEKQQSGDVGPACVGESTAYAGFLATAFPDLEVVGVPNTEDGFLAGFQNGNCTVGINAEHAALHFIKTRFETDTCKVDEMPLGVIGESLQFGPTQMAVGFGKDMDQNVVDTISYWLNAQMTCAPGADGCDGSLQQSWKAYAGKGDACGYSGFVDRDPSSVRASGVSIASAVAFAMGAGALLL